MGREYQIHRVSRVDQICPNRQNKDVLEPVSPKFVWMDRTPTFYQEDQVHSCPNVHSSARPNFWYSRTENGPCNPAIGTRRAKHHPWAFSKPGRCGIIGQFPNHLGIEDAYWPFPRRYSQWTKCRRDRNIWWNRAKFQVHGTT